MKQFLHRALLVVIFILLFSLVASLRCVPVNTPGHRKLCEQGSPDLRPINTAAMSNQPLALEYHGKAQAEGHWRRGQELIDALAYIDPLTPDVKQQVDKLVEEEMRRSTKRPADYLKEMPPIRPARFEGHPMLQQEYERWVPAVVSK